MGFLDELFDNSRYLNKERQPKAESAAKAPREEPPVRASTGSEPDYPVAFGYKCNWLCVRSDSPTDVIQKLGLKNFEPSNWDKGIEMAYNGYRFVSPVLDGYVLVVNYGMDLITLAPDLLDESAKKFPELQYFSTHRVSEYHAWIKYVNGEMVRGYGWCGCDGEVLLNRGALTPEEERLGFAGLIKSSDDDWDKVEFPNEDYVLEIAAAWGVDTGFSGVDYPKSMGYICR
ncbi:MAG: hypothetical protein NC299_04905 [Lachnospiraceae bacterium]|nr:hypothetical protein [Ruminococcus sp.]MCM1274689.1 hypothetical protein [Lachnospiraceae bacterium]